MKEAGKQPELPYKFARAINSNQMPLERLPFGMIAYQVEFFNASHINEVQKSTVTKLLCTCVDTFHIFVSLFSTKLFK